MEFRTAPCVIDAIKAEADFGVLGYHRLTDSFRESCCQWMKTRHELGRSARLDRPLRAGGSRPL